MYVHPFHTEPLPSLPLPHNPLIHRDQVMRIFEYYEEAHLDRQHQVDAARSARKAARYALSLFSSSLNLLVAH